MKNFLYFEAGGSNYDIGYIIGKKTRNLILKVLPKRKKRLLKKTNKNYSTLIGLARKSISFAGGEFKHLNQELEGIAKGANIPFEDILFLTFDEEFDELAFSPEEEMPAERCTTIAVKENENFYLAHNEDYEKDFYNNFYIVKIARHNTPHGLACGFAGTLAGSVCGLNQHGIGFFGNSIHMGFKIGIPKNFILRCLLEVKTMSEAIKILSLKPRSLSQNTTIVSANEQKMASVEATFDAMDILSSKRRYLLHTNHLLSNNLDNKRENSTIYSRLRFSHADFILAKKRGKIDVKFLKETLKASGVFVRTILFGRDQTLASIIIDFSKQTLLVRNTYNRKNNYYNYSLTPPKPAIPAQTTLLLSPPPLTK